LALALASAAVGLGTALTLVRLFGVRRGRLIAQVSGALLGASAYLATQLHHFLPPGAASLVARAVSALSEQPAFLLPANAARGDLVALALLGMIALVASGTIAWALGRSLLRGAQDAEVRLPRGTQRAPRRWRGSPWSVGLRKELRLIVRDPLLLAKVLPSAFYLLPAALVFGRTLGGTVFASIAVIFAGQFSSVLTRVTADGEECWDLIRLSPSDEHDQRTVKMVAGFTLPALIATTFCIVTAFFGAPGTAAIGLVCSLAVGAAAARVQVSSIRPTPRRDVMKRRKGDFNPLQLLVGFLMFLGMLGVGFFARGWHWPGLVVSSVTLIAAAMTYQLVRFKETHFPHS
ncbi:MAG TPA: hypothetical protein VHF69_08455, partial [Candidatus Synoicihabitans sp.]|nr:hypothetical protein [Candidatus Synoicihabitans sp.]